jgi:hypothetical protein
MDVIAVTEKGFAASSNPLKSRGHLIWPPHDQKVGPQDEIESWGLISRAMATLCVLFRGADACDHKIVFIVLSCSPRITRAATEGKARMLDPPE